MRRLEVGTVPKPGTQVAVSRSVPQDRDDLSLVLGGPLYQLYLHTKLARAPLDLLYRRVLGISLICWLPLLLLSLAENHAISGVRVPFLLDVETYARFIVALPLLIASEVIVHR